MVHVERIAELQKQVQEKRQRKEEERKRQQREEEEQQIKMLLKELDAESPAKAAKKRHHKHKRRPPSPSGSDSSDGSKTMDESPSDIKAAAIMQSQRPLASQASLEWHYDNISQAAKYNALLGASSQQLQMEAHRSGTYQKKKKKQRLG